MSAVLDSPYTNTYAHTRPKASTGNYAVETIGHQAGASLLRANPNLGKSAIPKPNGSLGYSSDRKEQRDQPLQDSHADRLTQFNNRFPPGTLAFQDPEMDPMQRMPSPDAPYAHYPNHANEEIESFEDDDQYHGQWTTQVHPPDPAAHQLAYEEPMDQKAQIYEEEERRARQYASMSPAEQYAMQAKIHSQSNQQFEDAPGGEHQRLASGEDDSLGSPFRARPPSSQARMAPRSASGSRATSRNDNGKYAPATKPHSTNRKPPMVAHRGSTTSLAYMSDPNTAPASTGTLSKDELLERMADALRKERAKNKTYMKELQESEKEIDAVSRLLDKTRAEAASTNSIQLATIASLRRELERTRQQLDDAREVGADDAERFLGLLDSVQFGSLKDKETAFRKFGSGESGDQDADFDLRHIVPDSKAEAILSLAANEAGGINAKARQRTAERNRRLDNALSTIASSSIAKGAGKQSGEVVPFPISSSDDEGTIRYKRVGPAVNIDLQKEGLPSATPSRFGLFRRRRSTNGSKAEVSTDDLASRAQKGSASKLKRPASQRRNSDPTMSITQEKNLQPRPSIDDALKADSPFVQKIAGGHLMPPLAARAHEGGTWGRSASSDVPRKEPGRFQINDPDLIFEDQKNSKNPPTGPRPSGGKRRGSFSKIMGKLFPMADPENQHRREATTKA